MPDSAAVTLTIYRCAECLRAFGSETAILDHQSLWAQLHSFDSEIDEHDGNPWTVESIQAGEYMDYSGRRVEFVEPDERGLVVRDHFPGRGLVAKIGSFDEVYVPRVDVQLVRAWAAALALGLEANEVRVEWHAEWLTMRWLRDPERLAEERHLMLSMIGLVQIIR